MDKNKLDKLNEICYKILSCCALCKNFEKGNVPNSIFGTCAKHSYFHLKHEESRHLSVSIFGTCLEFKASESKMEVLELFSSFKRE